MFIYIQCYRDNFNHVTPGHCHLPPPPPPPPPPPRSGIYIDDRWTHPIYYSHKAVMTDITLYIRICCPSEHCLVDHYRDGLGNRASRTSGTLPDCPTVMVILYSPRSGGNPWNDNQVQCLTIHTYITTTEYQPNNSTMTEDTCRGVFWIARFIKVASVPTIQKTIKEDKKEYIWSYFFAQFSVTTDCVMGL